MALNLGHIYATLGLDSSQLTHAAGDAEKRLSTLGTTMGNVATKVAALGAAALVAAPALIAAFVKSGMASITAQQDLANSLDVSIDGLRALQLAAAEAGVDAGTLNGALAMMNSRLGAAQRGTGPAAEALKKMGLDAKALADMDIDERMATIADKVRELGLSSSQTAAFLREFGIRGGEMVELFRQGGDAIRSATGDVQEFGISLSAIDAKMVDNAEESIQRMGLTLEGVKNSVTIALAPVLGELADRFNDASKESDGFGEMAISVMRGVAKAISYVGNLFHGWEVIFGTLKVGFAAVAVGINAGSTLIAKGFAKTLDFINSGINMLIDAVNKFGANIPKIPSFADSEFMKTLESDTDSAKGFLSDALTELKREAKEAFPSEVVDEFFDAADKRRREMAKQQVEEREKPTADYEDVDEEAKKKSAALAKEKAARDKAAAAELEALNKRRKAEDEAQMVAAEAARNALADRLDAVREAAMSETELANKALADKLILVQEGIDADILMTEEGQAIKTALIEKEMEARRVAEEEAFNRRRELAVSDLTAEMEEHQAKLDFMEKAKEDGIVSEEEYRARVEELEQQHMDRLYALRQAGLERLTQVTISAFHQQAKFSAGYLADITASVARENKVMFEINKAAGIANALLNAKEAIIGAYKVGAGIGGPPVGAAFAAVAAAATAAQVAAIASQTYGGKGGAAPSLAGGTPATPVTPVTGGTGGGRNSRLTVEGIDPGAIFSGRQMRDLAERLLEYQRDGGTVVIR